MELFFDDFGRINIGEIWCVRCDCVVKKGEKFGCYGWGWVIMNDEFLKINVCVVYVRIFFMKLVLVMVVIFLMIFFCVGGLGLGN